MFGCISRCFPCFRVEPQQYRRRGRGRRRDVHAFGVEDELVEYDELQVEEAAVRVEQVAEAARNAERRDLAPSLRDESLIARLTHHLNTGSNLHNSIGDLESSDAQEGLKPAIPSSAVFVATLQSLQNSKVIAVVVESLWNTTRHRWRKRETTRLLSLFQLGIATTLSHASQQELYGIILDLPPAVMGDAQAQQTSRVLIDVPRDVREEMMRKRADLSTSSRRQVDSAVVAFDNQLKNLELTGAQMEVEKIELKHPTQKPFKPGSIEPHIALYFDIMISMLLEIPEFDRFRILLSQLLLSKHLPADTTLRASVLELVFPSRPPTPQLATSSTPLIPVNPSSSTLDLV